MKTSQSSVEVIGKALFEINKSKLYRQTRKTFEEYCKDRFAVNSNKQKQQMKSTKPTVKNPQISTSNNYAQFVYNAEQRDIKLNNVKALMESMTRFGFLPSKPIQCYQKGAKLVIIDGHNRFVAAKNLSIPLLYVIEPESNQETMPFVNSAVVRWAVKDFVTMYAKRGIADYKEILKYQAAGFPIKLAADLLAGNAPVNNGGAGSLVGKNLALGIFKVLDHKRIAPIASMVELYSPTHPAYKSRQFISALDMCLRVSEFDMDRFQKKVIKNPGAIQKTATTDQMLDTFEEVYNHGSTVKIPLSFMAKQKKLG